MTKRDIYPAFQGESLSRWQLLSTAQKVGGRLQWLNGGFTLESQGLKVEFSIANAQQTHSEIQNGDIVGVSFTEPLTFKNKISLSNVHMQRLSPRLPHDFHPGLSAEDLNSFQNFLNTTRQTLQSRGLASVRSPSFVEQPGYEPTLDPFSVELQFGSKKKTMFLPTSPELTHKKMLSVGWTDIYEIRSCFRNGEVSEQHQPEFTMLEWYRAYTDLRLIQKDVEALFKACGVHIEFATATIAELFKKYLNIDLAPETPREILKKALEEKGEKPGADETFDDLFHRAFIQFIEPFIGMDNPLWVKDYPPSQAALARINSKGWADRMELYWRGFELANGFHELNNPDEQQERCMKDLETRKSLGKMSLPHDQKFIEALRSGMPPSAGMALGLDRLWAAIHGRKAILPFIDIFF